MEFPAYKLSLQESPKAKESDSNCPFSEHHDLLLNKAKIIDKNKMSYKHVNSQLLPKGSVMILDLEGKGNVAEKGLADFLCGASEYEKNVIGVFLRYISIHIYCACEKMQLLN